MPQPHTGELVPSEKQLWTFDALGNLIVANTIYTGGVPDPAKQGPGQPLIPGTPVLALAGGNLTVPGNLTVDGTSTVDGNSSVGGNLTVDGNGTVDGNLTVDGTITGTFTGAIGLQPSGDTTGTDDTAAIAAALTAASALGADVQLGPGVFWTDAPSVIPSGVTLTGSHGNIISTTDYGTTIKPVAAFTGTAVIEFAASTSEPAVRDLNIDGSSGPAGVDGIASSGATGAYLQNLCLTGVTGTGILQSSSDSTWYADRVMVHQAGGTAYSLTSADSVWTGCKTLGSGTTGTFDGWDITSGVTNTKLIGCASEWSSGNGYKLSGSYSAAGSGGLTLTGCSTDRNTLSGFVNVATSGLPVQLTGCEFRRDGRNGGSGGGSYAGVAVTAATASTQLAGCVVMPGTDDNGTGTNSPEYGLSVTSSSSYVRVSGSVLWGQTAAINDDGTSNLTMVSPDTLTMSGATSGPTVNPRQGRAFLSAGAATVAYPYVLSNSRIHLTVVIPGGTVGSPYVNVITAGTGFTVKSTSSTDTSTVAWMIE